MPYGETCLLGEDLWEDGESGVCPLETWTDVHNFHRKTSCCSFYSFLSAFVFPDTSRHRSLTCLCWIVDGGRESAGRLGGFLWLNVLVTVTF